MTSAITICMGSSCFARGNNRNLEIIRKFLEAHGLDNSIELSGHRCQNACTEGPNVRIGDTIWHGVDEGMLGDLLQRLLKEDDKGAAETETDEGTS